MRWKGVWWIGQENARCNERKRAGVVARTQQPDETSGRGQVKSKVTACRQLKLRHFLCAL